MNRSFLIMLGVLLTSSCSYIKPPAYQKEKSVESRSEYNGVEGMAQYQKDQSYLMRKSQCEQANKDLMLELDNDNDNEKISDLKEQIKELCF